MAGDKKLFWKVQCVVEKPCEVKNVLNCHTHGLLDKHGIELSMNAYDPALVPAVCEYLNTFARYVAYDGWILKEGENIESGIVVLHITKGCPEHEDLDFFLHLSGIYPPCGGCSVEEQKWTTSCVFKV